MKKIQKCSWLDVKRKKMRTKKKQKMTVVLRLYPEDALKILADLYKQKRLTENQYLSKCDKAFALLNDNPEQKKD